MTPYYNFAMIRADGKRARKSLEAYRSRKALAPLRHILSSLVTPNSAISALAAVAIAPIVVAAWA